MFRNAACAASDREPPRDQRASKSTAVKKGIIAGVFVVLIGLGVVLPLLFAGVIETAEAEVRLTSAQSLDGWRSAHPECEWSPADGDGAALGVEGTARCRYSGDTRPFTLDGIEAFPGDRLDSGILISSEIDSASARAPAWWVQGLTALVLIGVAIAALSLSGWSWPEEKRHLGKALAWVLPVVLVGMQALWIVGSGAQSDAQTAVPWMAQMMGPAFVIVAVILGPLAEEACYRQYLYAALRGFPLAVGALVTSGLFALAHLGVLLGGEFEFSLAFALGTYFFVGLVLFAVRHVSGALLPCVLTHAGLNALVLVFGPY